MVWKFIALLALFGIVNAIELHHVPIIKGYAAPALIKAPIAIKTVEIEEGPSEYEFEYSVHDPHTGDIKSQKESRKGDVVEGSYELIDPDGHRRIVKYQADKHSGFNAQVYREPTDIKIPIPEKKFLAPAKLIAPAPIIHYAAAPITKVYAAAPKIIASHGHEAHVSFAAPEFSYHY